MAIFRVEKSKNYTVMSNCHLRDKRLTLKAKGLLSQMLSLPDDWDYTLKGLSFINREKIDAIREAVKELETAGYIVRSRERDEKGRLRGAVYVIYETPQLASDLPTLENPTLDNPTLEKPTLEKPTLENPTQLNKDNIEDTDNTNLSNNQSLPPQPLQFRPLNKKIDRSMDDIREDIKARISYDVLVDEYGELDSIVEIICEVYTVRKMYIRVNSRDIRSENVKGVFDKVNSMHVEYAIERFRMYTSNNEVSNPRALMRSFLYNAIQNMDLEEGAKARYALNNRH